MYALSIRQPWAWAILHAGKNIENRTWRPPAAMIGQRFLIHASTWGGTTALYEDFTYEVLPRVRASGRVPKRDLPPVTTRNLLDARGGIVGSAVLTGYVEKSDSPWFVGPVGFLLDDVRALPFVPLKGAPGFFRVPDHLTPKQFRDWTGVEAPSSLGR